MFRLQFRLQLSLNPAGRWRMFGLSLNLRPSYFSRAIIAPVARYAFMLALRLSVCDAAEPTPNFRPHYEHASVARSLDP